MRYGLADEEDRKLMKRHIQAPEKTRNRPRRKKELARNRPRKKIELARFARRRKPELARFEIGKRKSHAVAQRERPLGLGWWRSDHGGWGNFRLEKLQPPQN